MYRQFQKVSTRRQPSTTTISNINYLDILQSNTFDDKIYTFINSDDNTVVPSSKLITLCTWSNHIIRLEEEYVYLNVGGRGGGLLVWSELCGGKRKSIWGSYREWNVIEKAPAI